MNRRICFIGGSAGAGKSTVARGLSQDLGAGWLQVDTLWIAAHDIAGSGSPDYELIRVDEAIKAARHSVDELLDHHIRAARRICEWLPRAIEFESQTHETLIVDGAWLLPEFLAGFTLDGVTTTSVMLHEHDRDLVQAAMSSRRARRMVAPWHDTGAHVAWLYGNWLAGQTAGTAIAVIDASPRETLMARVRKGLAL